MKKVLLCLLVAGSLLVGGCGADEDKARPQAAAPEGGSWEEILEKARGSRVAWYMYGGMANANRWVDEYVAPEVLRRYGITLERVPMDAPVFVNKLLAEKAAGRAQGTMDLLWINGENFRNAREADLLYGPVTHLLPNFAAYADPAEAATDFGYPVDGYEAPYGRAQFVLEYDSSRTATPPDSLEALKEWVRVNPGRFTYPQPPDFTGSAFVRQAFYALTGGHEQYMEGFSQELYDRNAPRLWAYLNEIEPYLWQGGQTYPKDPAAQALLFARGEVDFMMAYHPVHAQSRILEGTYPATTRTFVMREGSIFNTHFTAVPFNAPNVNGALVVMNFLLSPDAQVSKLDPANWGDFPAIDMERLAPEEAARFAAVDLGAATLGTEVLGAVAVPEIPAQWLEALEQGWLDNVLRK
nr:ABC transporter substrate-binding protein [Desulfovibrio psychrotolerans]